MMARVSNNARPRITFFGLSTFQALAMFRRGIFYTFLGIYLRSFLGLSVTETTLFETIPMLGNILFQTFVWGRLTDRFQLRRSFIIAGELAAGVGHVLMFALHAAQADLRSAGWIIIWSLTVIEIFWSMSNIGWSAYISDVYEPEERNSVQGKLASIGGAGRMVGALIGGGLYDKLGQAYPGWGFREGSIFLVAAAVMMVSVIPMFFMPEGGIRKVPKGSASAGAKPLSPTSPRAHAGAARAGTSGDLRVYIVFLAAMLLINSGVNSLAAIRGQFLDLKEGFAASATQISFTANVESAALILVGFCMGALGRKMGIRALMTLGAAFGVAYLALYAAAPGLWLIYPASLLRGLSDGFLAASSYAFASLLIPPEKRGRYFAAYNATFMLSWGTSATFITGPIIDGIIKAGGGAVFAYRMGMLSSALTSLAGLGLLALLLGRMNRKGRSLIAVESSG